MPISSGPNTAGESNLVFNYDTGDIVNSYKGEPTTNLAAFNIASSAVAFNTDTPGNLTQTANSTEATFQGRLSRKMVVGAGYWNAYVYGYNTGVSSTVFAVSYKIKTSDGSHPSTIVTGGYIYGSAGTFFPAPTFTYVSDGWYLATMLYSGTSMTLNSLTGMNGYGPKTFYITDYQAEALSHSTPFVAAGTSRSVTGSLFDISGYTNIINLSSVSFDSNAQMTFDGTDDQINMDSYASVIPYGQSITVETLVQFNTFAPNDVVVAYGGNGTGKGFLLQYEFTSGLSFSVFDISVGGTAGIGTAASAAYTGKYTHMVGVYNQSQVLLYLNGVNVASANYTAGLPQETTFRIGNEYARSYYSNMNLPIARVYNRALSASEIAQNYNQLKTRFNIS